MSTRSTMILRTPWLIPLAAALAVGLFTIDGGFVYDDSPSIVENPTIQPDVSFTEVFRRDIWGNPLEQGIPGYRPLMNLVWKAVWHVFPGNPMPFRVLTVLFHCIATMGVVLVTRRLTRNPAVACVAGLLFAIHSVHSEALGGITWQSDVISVALGLFALWIALGGTGTARSVLAAALVLSSCLIKESGFVFGVAIIAAQLLREDAGRFERIRAVSAVLVVTLAIIAIQLSLDRTTGRVFSNNISFAAQGYERLLLGFSIVGRCLGLCFFPVGLAPSHGYAAVDLEASTLLPAAIPGVLLTALAVAAGVYYVLKRNVAVVVCLIVLGLPVLLQSNLFVEVHTDLAERLLYASSAASSTLVGYLLVRHVKSPWTRRTVLVVVVAGMLVQSWRSQRPWRDDGSLWRYAVVAEPKAYRSQRNLSEVLIVEGKIDEGAWHRMLAEYMRMRFPGAVDWSVVEGLERQQVRQRLLQAPAVLVPEDPCGFTNGFLDKMSRRVPGFMEATGPYFKSRYGNCIPGPGFDGS